MEKHMAVNHPSASSASATDDQDILDNIDGHRHGPMSGFIKKYFGKIEYVHQEALLAGRAGGPCAVPSAAPSTDNFLQWFSNYISREFDGARGSWHVSGGNVAPERENADDGARLLLTIPTSPALDAQMRWDHVQVIGQ